MSGQYTQAGQRGQRMARAVPGYALRWENGLTIFPARDRVFFAMCFVALGEVSESAEGARLLSEYTGLNLYRGFKSLPLRQQETRQLVFTDCLFSYLPTDTRTAALAFHESHAPLDEGAAWRWHLGSKRSGRNAHAAISVAFLLLDKQNDAPGAVDTIHYLLGGKSRGHQAPRPKGKRSAYD